MMCSLTLFVFYSALFFILPQKHRYFAYLHSSSPDTPSHCIINQFYLQDIYTRKLYWFRIFAPHWFSFVLIFFILYNFIWFKVTCHSCPFVSLTLLFELDFCCLLLTFPKRRLYKYLHCHFRCYCYFPFRFNSCFPLSLLHEYFATLTQAVWLGALTNNKSAN